MIVFHCRPCRQSFAIADQEGMHRRRSLALYTGCRNKRGIYSSCKHSKKESAACYKRKPATKVKVTPMTEDWANHLGVECNNSTALWMLQLETHNFYYNYAKNVPLIRRSRSSISKEIRSIVTTLVRNILHRTTRHKFPATMEFIQSHRLSGKNGFYNALDLPLGELYSSACRKVIVGKYVIAWFQVFPVGSKHYRPQ